MKRTNLFIALLAVMVLSVAQAQTHRLTTDRNAYRPADRIVKQQVEFKDPGSAGKELTWDFRTLQPVNEEYKLDYFIPDSTRMDTLCGREHNTRYYYSQKRDSLWAVGFENSTTLMEYLKPELKLRFPFGYGDTLRSNFEGTGQYSHRLDLKVKGYTRVEADAEGELLLPDFETVKRALRVHTLRYYTQTGRDSIEMQLDTYAWYAEGIRYPVFESIRTNLIKKARKHAATSPQGEGAGGEVDTTIFTTSFYYPPELQISQVQTDSISQNSESIQGAEVVFTEATMQPNPVVSNLYINYKLTRPATIWFSVHNNAGIPVRQTTPKAMSAGYNYTTINMSNTLTGTYTVYVHVDDMVLQRVVIKK